MYVDDLNDVKVHAKYDSIVKHRQSPTGAADKSLHQVYRRPWVNLGQLEQWPPTVQSGPPGAAHINLWS